MSKLSKWLWVGILVFAFASCTARDRNSPQGVLAEYVAKGFSVKSPEDKHKLIEYTTGDVKQSLEALDSQSFKEKFIDSKRKFVSLKIRDERNIGHEQHSITYELTYNSANADQVTIKKHATFVKKDSRWLISEVRNIKTFVEHKEDFSF